MKTIHSQSNHVSDGSILLKLGILLLVLLLLGGVFYGTYRWQHAEVAKLEKEIAQLNTQLSDIKDNNTVTYTSAKGVSAKVYLPSKSAKVDSPLKVLGEIPGNWSFEASFPVVLKDADGAVIAQAPAQVLGDWMTTELVPFSLELSFSSAASGDATLIMQKDNPSGLPENDDTIIIPVVLE
jgi:hypothetical protein